MEIKIKIIKSNVEMLWYHKLIGEMFTVREQSNIEWRVIAGDFTGMHVFKEDAEVVEENNYEHQMCKKEKCIYYDYTKGIHREKCKSCFAEKEKYVNFKPKQEVVEEVKKSCSNCDYHYWKEVDKCKIGSIYYCPNNKFNDWQPIKSDEIKTKPVTFSDIGKAAMDAGRAIVGAVNGIEKSCKECDTYHCTNGLACKWQPIEAKGLETKQEIERKNSCKNCNQGYKYNTYRIDGCPIICNMNFSGWHPVINDDQWDVFQDNCIKPIAFAIKHKQATGTTGDAKSAKQPGKFENIGRSLGELVDEKQHAYGDAITVTERMMKELYPNGIKPNQYRDALLQVRILDKQCRIARGDESKFGESPFKDIAGYGLLGVGHE